MSHHRDQVLAEIPKAVFEYVVGAGNERIIDLMFADAQLSMATAHYDHLADKAANVRPHLHAAIAALICLVADLDRIDDETNSTIVKPEQDPKFDLFRAMGESK